ncbi:hypothetical protein N0V82_008670 [Gnomoniopsis sp. IMI 355080]|nr:hypothetical protein N0V82_008670 [Gnomoniopsis sp. IMI 355080]
MESLQLAQMLADISDLSAADQKAASAMLNANKTLPTNPPTHGDHLKAPTSAPAGSSPYPYSSNRFDKFGRKILTPPNMSRTNSSTGPTSRQGSMPGTPRGELDDDIHQAGSLMSLYEIRARLKQQDSTGLKKAREQIDALVAKNKQQQQQQQGGQSSQGEAQKQDRPRPVSRTYTYPRESTTGTGENK